MRTVALASGTQVPALGQGTWKMGERNTMRRDEVAALRLGIELGMTLVDTAEMYASGGAEEVTGEAIAGRRNEIFLVSKVLPSNASASGTIKACEASLKRLGTDRIDLYLLHWRGRFGLTETVEGFEALKQQGKIGGWGVSNFDTGDMAELAGVANGNAVETNQVLYNLSTRGIEYDLMPAQRCSGIAVMAYSPVGQGDLAANAKLDVVAKRHGATCAQIALAWTLRDPMVISIPKAATAAHVRDNSAALDIVLTDADLAELDAVFPPPTRKQPLDMI